MRNPRAKSKSQNEVIVARGRLRGALHDMFDEADDESDSLSSAEDDNSMEADTPPPPPPQRGRPPKRGRGATALTQSPRSSRPDSLSPSCSVNRTPTKRRQLLRDQQQSEVRNKPQQRQQQHNQQQQQQQQQQQKGMESFVMKLFDRSLDLSKYEENTPLYPICRAWMHNQPRNPAIPNYRERRSASPCKREDNGYQLLQQLRNHEVNEVLVMPRPLATDLHAYPTPPPLALGRGADIIDPELLPQAIAQYDDYTAQDMLALHMPRWKQIRSDWVTTLKSYRQARFQHNWDILQELYKREVQPLK